MVRHFLLPPGIIFKIIINSILAKELGRCKTELKQFSKKTCFPRMFSLDKITKVATCTSLHNQTFLRPMCLK